MRADRAYDPGRHPWLDTGTFPAFRIEGNYFDHYAPTTGSARAIWTQVFLRVVIGQANRMTLSLDDSPVSLDDLREEFRYPIDGLVEVIVVADDQVVPLFP